MKAKSWQSGSLVADKCHPVIWYADDLSRWIPTAKFVGIHRNPFATVSSMLRHDGVLRWQRKWERYGTPNEFLGITSENRHDYARASDAGKAAYRWVSHTRRLGALNTILGGEQYLTVNYDALSRNYEHEVLRLWDFLNLPSVDASKSAPKVASRGAWRELLTDGQREEVAWVTGFDPTVEYSDLSLDEIVSRL